MSDFPATPSPTPEVPAPVAPTATDAPTELTGLTPLTGLTTAGSGAAARGQGAAGIRTAAEIPHPRGAWRGLVGCGLVVFLGCLLVAGGHLYSPDEEILFRLTESIATRGAFDIEPLQGFATRAGRGGLQYPQYPPLQAVLATPLYAFARMTRPLVSDDAILRAAWETTQYHDRTPDAYWSRFWVAMGFNPVVTALTAMLLWAMARRLSGGDRSAAWLVALLYGFSTLALPHSRTFFTEPLATLWMMASMAALLVWADRRRGGAANDVGNSVKACVRWPLLAGLAAAAGVWTRVDFPLFLPGLSLGVCLLALPVGWWTARPFSGASIRRIAWPSLFAFAIPVAISLAGWFLFNRWRFGGASATGGYEDQPEGVMFGTPFLIGLHGFLCSPGKGLFFFSPALLLALFGWRKMAAARPVWTAIAAATGGLFFIAMCKWQNWPGGWCWGPRHIFQIHALLILGLAPLLATPRTTVVRIAVAVAMVVGVAVQLFGSSQSFIDFYQEFFGFTPRQPPNFHALYSPQEDAAIQQAYTILAQTQGGPVASPAHVLPAPINDSIYVPQSTQWYGYPILIRARKHDFFWWHLLR